MRIVRFIFLCLIVLAAGCREKEKPPAAAPEFPVKVLTVREGLRHNTYQTVAVLKPYRTVELSNRITGHLIARNFTEGGFVKSGTVLYEIEPDQYRISVERAQAALDLSLARSVKADSDYKRIDSLYRESVTPPDRYDQYLASKLEAEAEVAAAKADLAQAKLELSYTGILAPFSGRIGFTQKDVGNYLASPGIALASLSDTSQIRVEFSVSDHYLFPELSAALQSGGASKYEVRVLVGAGVPAGKNGNISFWSNSIDTGNAALTIQALLSNEDGALLAGQFVKVELRSPTAEKALLLGEAGIHYNQTAAFVYMLDGESKLTMRPVRLGGWNGSDRIVEDGLAPGDKVVAAGNPLLRPGMKVRVIGEVNQ